VKAELKDGLQKYAVVEKDGKRKILHGWGDERSYLVGSFSDVDGESRDGLTANAFWVISGAYLWDKTIKKDILESFSRLDSKYGMKTFEPYFKPGTKGVGRIVNLPKGTAENAATYVHATLFGIAALFDLGEGQKAWEQLKKVLPLTHAMISTTPFIMSNSYSYNKELLLDGESMSDWFTGSANTLLKTLVWQFFGICPDLNGVKCSPSVYFPFSSASIRLSVKGKEITVNYSQSHGEKRTFLFNGKELPAFSDASSSAPTVYIRTEDLLPINTIEVF
jgi:cellobiose phosphorylase